MESSARQLSSNRAAVPKLWQGQTLCKGLQECQGPAERLTGRQAARAQAERPTARASNNCCSRNSSVEFSPGICGICTRESPRGYRISLGYIVRQDFQENTTNKCSNERHEAKRKFFFSRLHAYDSTGRRRSRNQNRRSYCANNRFHRRGIVLRFNTGNGLL
jgi:hypothetical protein